MLKVPGETGAVWLHCNFKVVTNYRICSVVTMCHWNELFNVF